MAANSTVPGIVTFVVVLAVVVSTVATPVAAAGDGPVSVADDDDDPVEVGIDNESAEVRVGDDSAAVDTDGDRPDAGEPADAVTGGASDAGSADDFTAGSTADDDELPVDYSDIPFWILQVDLCDPPVDPSDPPAPPVDPTDPPEPVPSVPNPSPVNPRDPPGTPFGHCEIFDPYRPPFDPTDLPDDPQYDSNVRQPEVSEDGVYVGAGGQASPDGEWPGVDTVGGVRVTPEGVTVIQLTTVDEGNRDSKVFSDVRLYPGARTAELRGWSVVIDRKAGASLLCNGDVCVAAGPAPAPSQEVPTNRSSDGGGDSPTVPCEAPEGSITPCDVYDPNRPPNASTSPQYNVYESRVDPNATVVGVAATFSESDSPSTNIITGVSRNRGEVRALQSTYARDGQNSYVLSASAAAEPDSATDAGLEGVNFHGGAEVGTHAFDDYAGVTMSCDGQFCYVGSESIPLGEQKVRIANDSSSNSSSQQTATTPGSGDGATDSEDDTTRSEDDTTRSEDDATTSDSTADSPSSDSPGSDSPAYSSGATATAGSSVTTVRPSPDRPIAIPFPAGLANGIPDVATATATLLERV